MMTRCSAASRVPFGGYAALDTASAAAPGWLLPTAVKKGHQSDIPGYDSYSARPVSYCYRFTPS